ncbi:Fic family protein [Actinophytocola sp.]|uniref:Fic family protein n=1 Tax=Actinophytocola sp. TaxID=1872138 RepID=UPI00389A585E
MPKPLPSSLEPDPLTQQRRSWADHTLGRLYEATAGLPDRNVLVRPTQRHEIQSMLAFRGIPVTNRELASIDLPDEGMRQQLPYNVARYVKVMGEATRDVREEPVAEVLKRVARDLAGLSAGSAPEEELPWRTTPRWFGGSPEQAYLSATPPGADLRAGAEQLFAWMDSPLEMTFVDKVALGAFQLFTLDPFTNTADLLHVYVTLELIRSGVLQDQILPVSVHIDRNRAEFHELHQHVVRSSDFNSWVRFFADGFAEQCGYQLRVVRELAQLPERYINKYMRTVKADKRRDGFARLVAILPRFQVVTSQLIADRCSFTAKRARELLLKAEELEFVEHVEVLRKTKIYEVKDVCRALDLYTGMTPERDLHVTEK